MIGKSGYGFLISFTISLLFLHSCYYDSKEYLFPEMTELCDTSSVTFTNSVQPVLSQYCLTCHSNITAASQGASVRLEDYSDIVIYAENGKLLGTVSHDGGYSPMPKGAAKLNDCLIRGFEIWIASGSPNN